MTENGKLVIENCLAIVEFIICFSIVYRVLNINRCAVLPQIQRSVV
jgi:hypothetical protein